MKRWKLALLLVATFIFLLPTNVEAKVDPSNYDKDPAVGTASQDKERAIEAGKQMIGKVNYWMDEHARSNKEILTFDYVNGRKGIDCSEFVAYAFHKGYGITWGGDNGHPLNTHGFVNTGNTPSQYLMKVSSYSDLKRGDIVLTNNHEHIVIYLGDGMILGSNGYNSISAESGPSIQPADWHTISTLKSNVIRLPDNAKDAKGGSLQQGTPDQSLKVSSSSVGSSDSESGNSVDSEPNIYVGEDAWKNKMVNFQDRIYKQQSKVFNLGSNGFVNNAFIVGLDGLSHSVLKNSYVVMMVLSSIIMFVMTVSIIFYLVVLPNYDGTKMGNIFTKVTGVEAYVTRRNTFDVLSKFGLALVVITCVYANLIPVMVSGVIKLIGFFL